MPNTHLDDPVVAAPRSFVARHPVAVLLTVGIAFVWITQLGFLLEEHPGPDHPHPRRRRLPGPPGGVGDRGVRAAARPSAARLRRSAMTGTTRSSS